MSNRIQVRPLFASKNDPPDGDVGVAGMQVQHAVGADHLERRIGALFPPAGQPRHKPAARKGARLKYGVHSYGQSVRENGITIGYRSGPLAR
jgi:hypothetical protein